MPGERAIQETVSSARGEFGDGRGVHSARSEAALAGCANATALRSGCDPVSIISPRPQPRGMLLPMDNVLKLVAIAVADEQAAQTLLHDLAPLRQKREGAAVT